METNEKLATNREAEMRKAAVIDFIEGLRVRALKSTAADSSFLRGQKEAILDAIDTSDKTSKAEKVELRELVEEMFAEIYGQLKADPRAEPLDEADLSFQQKLFDSEA